MRRTTGAARANKVTKPLRPGEQAWMDNMARLIVGPYGLPCETCGGIEAGPQHHDPGGLTPSRWHRYLAPHIPGTDYYDGRDGSIEADDDDEDRIAAEDEARREEWAEFLEWQRSLGA